MQIIIKHPLVKVALKLVVSNKKMEVEVRVEAVEKMIGYKFRTKKLLEDALTHSSFTTSHSYQRLEFVGDAVLGLAISNHLFLAYPSLDPGQLSLLRAANVSTEKLARLAVRHGLHRFLRHNSPPLSLKIQEFVEAVAEEDDPVAYGGLVKAPKVLADIVESLAAAVYMDVEFDLQKLWMIIRCLLEPMVTPEHLTQQPQPVTTLFMLCQKNGNQVDIKQRRNGAKSIASVYVDGEFLLSASNEQKDIARLDAARAALHKLANLFPANNGTLDHCADINGSFEIESAKNVLHDLCAKKKWSKPVYGIENEEGPPHDKKFVCYVHVATSNGTFQISGDVKSRVKDAENSAASFLIRALQESNRL